MTVLVPLGLPSSMRRTSSLQVNKAASPDGISHAVIKHLTGDLGPVCMTLYFVPKERGAWWNLKSFKFFPSYLEAYFFKLRDKIFFYRQTKGLSICVCCTFSDDGEQQISFLYITQLSLSHCFIQSVWYVYMYVYMWLHTIKLDDAL